MKRVGVSDHAIIRYLERVVGLDIEALRADIAASCARAGDAPCVRVEHARYIIKGATVITVLDAQTIPRHDFLTQIARINSEAAKR